MLIYHYMNVFLHLCCKACSDLLIFCLICLDMCCKDVARLNLACPVSAYLQKVHAQAGATPEGFPKGYKAS